MANPTPRHHVRLPARALQAGVRPQYVVTLKLLAGHHDYLRRHKKLPTTDGSAWLHPGLAGFAELSGLPVRTAIRHLQALGRLGLIHQARRGGDGRRSKADKARLGAKGMASDWTITPTGWDLVRGRMEAGQLGPSPAEVQARSERARNAAAIRHGRCATLAQRTGAYAPKKEGGTSNAPKAADADARRSPVGLPPSGPEPGTVKPAGRSTHATPTPAATTARSVLEAFKPRHSPRTTDTPPARTADTVRTPTGRTVIASAPAPDYPVTRTKVDASWFEQFAANAAARARQRGGA